MKKTKKILISLILSFMLINQSSASFETSKDSNNNEINISRGELFTERVNVIGNQIEITNKENSNFLNLKDSTNNKSVGIYTGRRDPNNRVEAQIGSLFINHSNGDLYTKTSDNGGDEGWQLSKGGETNINKNIAKIIQTDDEQISPGNKKINFNSVEFDGNSLADLSKDEIRIKEAGKYLITGAVTVSGLSDIDYQIRAEITINGKFVAEGSNRSADRQVATAAATTIRELKVGDKVSLHVNNNSPQPVFTVDANQNQRPRLSVAKIDSFESSKQQQQPEESGSTLKFVSNTTLLNFGNNSFSNGTLSIAGQTGGDTPTAAIISIQLCAQSTSNNYTANTFTFTAPGSPARIEARMMHAGAGVDSGSCVTGQYIVPVSPSGQIIVSRSNAASSASGSIVLVGYYH